MEFNNVEVYLINCLGVELFYYEPDNSLCCIAPPGVHRAIQKMIRNVTRLDIYYKNEIKYTYKLQSINSVRILANKLQIYFRSQNIKCVVREFDNDTRNDSTDTSSNTDSSGFESYEEE